MTKEYERVKKEALLTEVEISDVIKRNTRGLENDKRICELEKAEWAIAKAQLDKVLKHDGIEIRTDKQEPPIKGYSPDVERMLAAGFVRVIPNEQP